MKHLKQAIDLEFFRGIVGDDTEFEQELFAIFLKSTEENIAKMKKALTANDNNLWYGASHALKGSAAAVGAFDLSKALETAQESSKADDSTKNKILKNIEEELKTVVDFIKTLHKK